MSNYLIQDPIFYMLHNHVDRLFEVKKFKNRAQLKYVLTDVKGPIISGCRLATLYTSVLDLF